MFNRKVSNSFLRFLYVLCILVMSGYLIALLTFGLIFVGSFLSNLFQGKPLIDLFNAIESNAGIGFKGNLILSIIEIGLVIGVIVLQTLIFYWIGQLLLEIRDRHIFNQLTLRLIRRVNYSFAGTLIIDAVLALIGFFTHEGGALPDGHSLGIAALAWFTIYVIQVVFERGLQLQKENNSII